MLAAQRGQDRSRPCPRCSRRRARLSAAADLGAGQPRRAGRVRGLAQQLQGVGGVQVLERLQRGREVLAQLVPQPLHRPGAFPDQRLMRARHHLDRLSLRAVPGGRAQWWESVRTMSASMCASPASLLAPDTPCRSRYREACSGFTGYTVYPAATSAATHGPRSVSIPTDHLRSLRVLAQVPRRSARAAARSRPRPPAAASSPAPSRPRPSPRRRDGPQPSHHPRTAAPASPVHDAESVSSLRENHQRPNEAVLTPTRTGTTSQQRSTLPVTGRGTIFQQGSKPGRTQCSPAGGHQHPESRRA